MRIFTMLDNLKNYKKSIKKAEGPKQPTEKKLLEEQKVGHEAEKDEYSYLRNSGKSHGGSGNYKMGGS